MDKERIDEALELLWILCEEGHFDLKRFSLSSDDQDVEQLIDMLAREGLVTVTSSEIKLSKTGYD
ncbi:MAG TPA: hypothetical protein VN260_10370, partial [Dissulfurispiraceae bacterium]|nr:hypothetical protein [Dissulfurispiraceae bacterium]